MGEAGFIVNDQGHDESKPKLDNTDPIHPDDNDELRGWTADPRFPEIPGECVTAQRWHTIMTGRWDFPRGILELEPRALVKLFDRVGAREAVMNVRTLLSGDNMFVVLAFGRCRA